MLPPHRFIRSGRVLFQSPEDAVPIYTYECPAGHRWEEQRSINDPTVDWSEGECSEGFSRGERVFAPGDMRPVFKGRGWARKDHKDASKP